MVSNQNLIKGAVMPEIVINYEADPSEPPPREALAAIVEAASKYFAVSELTWTRRYDDTPEQDGGQATCACGLRAPEFRPDPTCPTHGGLQPGEQLRYGSQVGRTLYAHAADNPKGRLIGVMDTPELAALVVDSVNARPPVVLPADEPEDPR